MEPADLINRKITLFEARSVLPETLTITARKTRSKAIGNRGFIISVAKENTGRLNMVIVVPTPAKVRITRYIKAVGRLHFFGENISWIAKRAVY